MARPSKRSPERVLAILGSLRVGNTRRASAAYADIHVDTFYEWLRDPTFSDAVEKAEADAETRFLGQIAKAAADGTWTAAAWWLERRRFDDYRKREGVELTGHDGGPIALRSVTDDLNDHEKQALRVAIDRELAKRQAELDPV
jgi:hypothetical protein